MNQVKETILVDDKQMEQIFLELETRSVIPFLYVTIKSEKDPSEIVKKSKIDGSINPYWKEITKQSSKSYRLVIDFKKRVGNGLTKEGKSIDTYQEGVLKGKEHISNSILTDTETQTERYVMLEYFVNNPIKGETIYFHNGNIIDKTLLENWMVFRDKNYSNQGLDKPIRVITPNIKSIIQVNIDGVIYRKK